MGWLALSEQKVRLEQQQKELLGPEPGRSELVTGRWGPWPAQQHGGVVLVKEWAWRRKVQLVHGGDEGEKGFLAMLRV